MICIVPALCARRYIQVLETVIPVRDAGQIGRTTDLLRPATRRVRDKDVPNASIVQGWQTVLTTDAHISTDSNKG